MWFSYLSGVIRTFADGAAFVSQEKNSKLYKMTEISNVTSQDYWATKLTTLTSKCSHILNTKEWCDVIFSFGKEPNIVEVKAHKLILSISSPVFAALFNGNLASKDKDQRIPIVDIDPPIFELLVRYVYTDSVGFNDVYEAFKLYYAAKKYLFPNLMETCVNYLRMHLEPDTALDIYEFAKFYEDTVLSDEAMLYSTKNAMEVLQKDSFLHINLETIVTLLERDDLNVETETDIINAIVRNEEILKSPNQMKMILGKIRFSRLTASQFVACQGTDMIFNSDDRYAILSKLTSPEREVLLPEYCDWQLKPREKVTSKTVNHFVSEIFADRSCIIKNNVTRSKFSSGATIQTNCHLKIVGISIATQVTNPPINSSQYTENINVIIADSNGVVLDSVHFQSATYFNRTMRINFSIPIELDPRLTYNITVIYNNSGLYPIAMASNKCEICNVVVNFSKLGVNEEELDGFIRGLIFKM